MVDVAPKQKPTPDDKIAQHLRSIGSIGGERRTAFTFAERDMRIAGRNWSDVGNAYQFYFKPGGPHDDPARFSEAGGPNASKFTEAEMQECAQAARRQGVEAGIKIGLAQAQASNGHANGSGVSGNVPAWGFSLPFPEKMADFCYAHLNLLDNKHHSFANKMYVQRGKRLSRRELGYLMSIYVQAGGKV